MKEINKNMKELKKECFNQTGFDLGKIELILK